MLRPPGALRAGRLGCDRSLLLRLDGGASGAGWLSYGDGMMTRTPSRASAGAALIGGCPSPARLRARVLRSVCATTGIACSFARSMLRIEAGTLRERSTST